MAPAVAFHFKDPQKPPLYKGKDEIVSDLAEKLKCEPNESVLFPRLYGAYHGELELRSPHGEARVASDLRSWQEQGIIPDYVRYNYHQEVIGF